MQRHMQNISFIAIVAVLLGCAFFFSQQTNLEDKQASVKNLPSVTPDVALELPICSEDLLGAEAQACLAEAAAVSARMVDTMVEGILAMETDSAKRINLKEIQFAWEDSRDADCAYVREMTSDKVQGEIKEAACLRDRNLERLDQLSAYLCEWYSSKSCPETPITDDL